MKRSFITTTLLFFLVINVQAQYALQKAGGKSGIAFYGSEGTINYDFSSDKAVLTFFREVMKSPDAECDTCKAPLPRDHQILNFSVGLPLKKSVGSIFDDGKFRPALDLALDYNIILEDSADLENDDFTLLFLRGVYEIQDNGFVFNDETAQSDFITRNRLAQKIGFGVGLNFVWDTKYVLALSAINTMNFNSTADLKKREVLTSSISGSNQNGSQITVNRKEERFEGMPQEFFESQLRADLSLPFGDDSRDKNKIGLLSSFSYNLRGNKINNSYNFSTGISLINKDQFRQVIAAILFEFTDFTDVNGNKDFDDIFGINLYVGLPFSILGLK